MEKMPNRMGRPIEKMDVGMGGADPSTVALLPLLQTRSLEIRMRNGFGAWISARLVTRVHSSSRGANVEVQHTLVHPN